MMELKGNGQEGPEPVPSIAPPYQEWVIEESAEHTYGTVDFIPGQGRGSDYHAFRQVMVAAGTGRLAGKLQVCGVEDRNIERKRDVARTDFSLTVGHDCVDGQGVVPDKASVDGKHIKFFYPGGGFADTPAHQHIEFETMPSTQTYKTADIQSLEKSDHRHRCFHPHLKGVGAGGVGGIYFFHFFRKVTAIRLLAIE